MTAPKTLTTEDFTHNRKPDDADLVQAVTALLEKHAHPAPQAWLNDPIVQEAKTASPKLQQFLINRYWRLQLGSSKEPTTRERYCLMDEGTPAQYLDIFEKLIVPGLLRCNLPQTF